MTGASDDTGGLPPSPNVAPTTTVPVLLHGTPRRATGDPSPPARVLRAMRWGLVPHWAPSPAVGARMINARVETVLAKSAFREPVRRRRCLVPATGWYEWTDPAVADASGIAGHTGPGVPSVRGGRGGRGGRQPWLTHREDGRPLLMAGLWTTWRAPGEDPTRLQERALLHTFAIVTRPAPAGLAWLHDRAPLLVPPPVVDEWLDQQCTEPAPLLDLLMHADDPQLHTHPVDPAVGDVRRQEPELVRPAPLVTAEADPIPHPAQPSLF